MSNLLFKLCPRCKRLKPVGNGDTHCIQCVKELAASRVRKRDYAREYEIRSEKEDPRYRRFYASRDWRMLSALYSSQHYYLCEDCGQVGTDVHHVIPIQTAEGWLRRLDPDNLRLLCVSCHNKAHNREFGRSRETNPLGGAKKFRPTRDNGAEGT